MGGGRGRHHPEMEFHGISVVPRSIRNNSGSLCSLGVGQKCSLGCGYKWNDCKVERNRLEGGTLWNYGHAAWDLGHRCKQHVDRWGIGSHGASFGKEWDLMGSCKCRLHCHSLGCLGDRQEQCLGCGGFGHDPQMEWDSLVQTELGDHEESLLCGGNRRKQRLGCRRRWHHPSLSNSLVQLHRRGMRRMRVIAWKG